MIFNMVGGGGGSGATLVVSSPANVSVTVSKDDKSYTKNSGSLGSATFKGLSTGTWTVVISGNGQTATRTIEITADYAITIAFFSATINITYPANSNCVVANSGGQTVASDTNTGTSAKTWTATVNAKGTYTITATATDGSGKTKSTTVSITAEGQVETVALSYELILFDGGVVVPWKVIQAKPTATISDTIYLHASDPTTPVVSAVRTTNKINLSGYSMLKYTVTENVNPEVAFMCVTSSTSAPINAGLSNTVTSAVVAYENPSATGTYSVDVSEVQGEYYVSIAEGHYPTSGLKVSKVWLE